MRLRRKGEAGLPHRDDPPQAGRRKPCAGVSPLRYRDQGRAVTELFAPTTRIDRAPPSFTSDT